MARVQASEPSVGSRPTTDDGTTTVAQAMTAIGVVKKFREAAERTYPEPVDEETFAELLAGLCATARMICDANSFYTWICEREEVDKFLDLRFELESETYPVNARGSIGRYVVHIYYLGDDPKYVEIEWVPGSGYSYDETKVFKLDEPEPARGVPLGSVINMLQSMGR